MKRLRRRAIGLTLVEVLVATALFAVATLGLAGVFPLQARAVASGRNVVAATALAEHELEGIVAGGYSGAVGGVRESVVTSTVNGVAVTTTFSCQTTVTLLASALKDVDVRVTWREGELAHEIAIETMLAP